MAALENLAARREPMPRNLVKIATLTATALFLLTSIASADDMASESIAVPSPSDASADYSETPTASAGYAETPISSEDDGWHYCSYYILPLTRHMQDSGLPLAGQIFLYPLAAAGGARRGIVPAVSRPTEVAGRLASAKHGSC
jgi:hypothetical protein